jgi:serine/threonine-protein kinase
LELRKLLGRFIDVCNAMEYAHSRGVLHRDLKPGNIMLGMYGETLVVDWGLAKAAGRSLEHASDGEPTLHPASAEGSTPTVMGSALGTPEYMSPEQAEGRIDLLGPRTDVYSLGATLYALLTGRPPVQDTNREEVLRMVRGGEFPRPRQLNWRIPAALEAICLKSMARRLEDRYDSPSALADDIERWLADEPVGAYREPWLATARRWARRHRVTVAAVAVLLVCSSIALAVGNVLVRNQRDIARRERDRAEQNAAATREVIERFLIEIGDDKLSQVPQFESVRVRLVETAVARYRRLLAQRPEDASLRSDAAMALRRCANLYRMVNQFGPARDLYDESLGIAEDLADGHGRNETYRSRLIDLLRDRADLVFRVDGPVAAEPVYQEASEAARQCRHDLPNSATVRKAEALVRTDYSEVLCSLSRCTDALQLFERQYNCGVNSNTG